MTFPRSVTSLALAAALVPATVLAAGNVTTETGGSTLRLLGDDAGNGVLLEKGPGNGIIVSGLNGTTIDGRDAPVIVPFDGDTMRIELGDGGDTVVMRELSVSKDLHLTPARKRLDTDDDDDDDDDAEVRARRLASDDNDTVVLQNVSVGRRIRVKLGPGDDRFEHTGGTVDNANVSAGSGMDELVVNQVSSGDKISLRGEADADDIRVDGARFSGKHGLAIDGHDGDDTIALTNIAGTRVIVRTRAGADEVEIEDSNFTDKVHVELDSQDDHAVFHRVFAVKRSTLNGGGGVDTYTDAGGNDFRGGLQLQAIDIRN